MRLTTAVLTLSLTLGLTVGCDETPARVLADADTTDAAALDAHALHPRGRIDDHGQGPAAGPVEGQRADAVGAGVGAMMYPLH